MPRLPRVHLQDVAYYVSLEGPQNELIFKDSADYKKYGELLAKFKDEFQFKLYAYALLPMRLELLIEATEDHPISQIMQKITPSYTKYYNSRYQRKGHLFLRRFRSIISEKESYLLALTRFIHLAPSRFRVGEDGAKLSQTSYGAYVNEAPLMSGGISINMNTEIGEVKAKLLEVGNVSSYEQYEQAIDKSELELLDKKLSRATILGSDEFVNEVRSRIKNYAHTETSASETVVKDIEGKAVASSAKSLPLFGVASGVALFMIVAGAAMSPMYLNKIGVEKKNTDALIEQPSSVTSDLLKETDQSQIEAQRIGVPTSPIAQIQEVESPNLNGTIWEVELVSVSPEGVETPIKDKIRFVGRAFESYYFSSHGFSRSNYSVTVHDNGVITWETMQHNEKGETISWRGDWNGIKMEGMLNYHPTGKTPEDFSFASNRFLVQQ